jgi:hypothetical protein
MTTSSPAGYGQDQEPPEAAMIRLAGDGQRLDLLETLDSGAKPTVKKMKKWGPERTIEAAALQRLLIGLSPKLHHKGVQLRGARIRGQLDLEAAKLRCPLRLEYCYLDGNPISVNLDYAEVSLFTLIHCVLAGLSGSTLKVTKGLNLAGSEFTGPVTLRDAHIMGLFCCTDAKLTGVASKDPEQDASDRQALAASHGYALDADGMTVHGNAMLDGEFKAVGGVWLNRANVAGELNCTGATLTAAFNPETDDHHAGDCAMYADGLMVGGSVVLTKCVATHGGIRLSTATISGELICSGTRLEDADRKGNALRANQLKVGGNVSIGPADKDGFVASRGKISLTNATIGGELRLRPKSLAGGKDEKGKDKIALDATGAQIAQKLWWEPTEEVRGEVNLENVTVGRLQDTWTAGRHDADPKRRGYWPDGGLLRLDGLTYDSIASSVDDRDNGAAERLEWIASQYGGSADSFATQPYEQLANFYLEAGRDADARRVAIARRRDSRRYARNGQRVGWLRWVGNWLLDNTIRYGYRTWRAAVMLAILLGLVACFYSCASHHGAIIATQVPPAAQTSPPTLRSIPTATHCANYYPCFNPFGYAVDTVIPIINVHQADFWGPNAHAADPWGFLSVLVSYLSTGLGWLLATLAVAGYTGLARNTAAP